LDSALARPCKLILLSAPAGFGKTTLAAEWIRRSGVSTAWLSLDKGDNHPARFWRFVVAALQIIQPGPGRSVAAALANEQTDISGPLVIVLDDSHEIDDRAIHESLTYLLDHLPPGMRILLTTRADPPLGLARLRGCLQLAETRIAELRFTRAKTG
jgi:LuxR family maltose regulon positive regulatory protein